MSLKTIFLIAAGLLLSGCVSTGVTIQRQAPPELLGERAVHVQASSSEIQWAAEQALQQQGWIINSSREGGATLMAYETLTMEARQDSDPFCDNWGGRAYGYYPWGGGFSGSCMLSSRRVIAYPVRTLTWSLEKNNGELIWYASARETRPSGPPLALSDRLASALAKWHSRAP